MSDITFREVSAEESARLLEYIQDTEHGGFRHAIFNPGNMAIVAECDGSLAGIATLYFGDEKKLPEIKTVYVYARHRGKRPGEKRLAVELSERAMRHLIARSNGRKIYVDCVRKAMHWALEDMPEDLKSHLTVNPSYRKGGDVQLPDSDIREQMRMMREDEDDQE